MYQTRYSRLLKISLLVSLTLLSLSYGERSRMETVKEFFSDFQTLPEYYFETDLKWFHNHKNKQFWETYLLESHTRFEAMVLSYKQKLFLGAYYINNLGMGRQYEDIVFDPRDVYYALSPYIELRHFNLVFQSGLDHTCIHEVDRKNIPTIYWNRIFFSVGSPRYPSLAARYNTSGFSSWNQLERLSWNYSFAFYITRFFNANPSVLSGGHQMKSVSQVQKNYALYGTDSWLFNAAHALQVEHDKSGAFYWSGLVGLEASFVKLRHGWSAFINYNYEFPRERPFLYKDRLLEIGMRFFY